jgi:hypothetical protein
MFPRRLPALQARAFRSKGYQGAFLRQPSRRGRTLILREKAEPRIVRLRIILKNALYSRFHRSALAEKAYYR